MTYQELLQQTAARKKKAIRELNEALSGNLGFLARAEMERDPGMVAWLWLAKGFCETLADNIDEIYASADCFEQRDIYDIYAAYENDEPDLYELLPVEAQLFTVE